MENGPPFKSEATPPSFHHFADHHFANQASLMMLPPGWGQCRVRTTRWPTPDRKMPPSDDGKMMVGKMMVRRPDGHGTRVFAFEPGPVRVQLLWRTFSWAAPSTPPGWYGHPVRLTRNRDGGTD